MSIIRFPTSANLMLETLQELFESGEVRELIVFAPNVRDPGRHHVSASDGISLMHVLLAKHEMEVLAQRFAGTATSKEQ